MHSTKEFLFKLYSSVKKKGKLDEEIVQYINSIFANKAQRVLDVIEKGITKYIYNPSKRIIWVAMGENCEHIIYPKIYCSCQDFYKNVVVKRKRDFCKHLIAQIICEALNEYNVLELEDNEFNKLINDLELKF
jgi:predicted nucleic acid-binding Zn finger protein